MWLQHRPRTQEKCFLFLVWALTSSVAMGDLGLLKGEFLGIPVTASGMWSLTISEKQSLALYNLVSLFMK